MMSSDVFKVLIVDDSPQNIDLLHQILSHENYSVSGVPSGRLALEVVRRFQPDVILLDVMMPDMDGFETCRRLKSNPETEKIPVIFITAKTDANDIAEGFRCGGADYISKPAKEEEVWARVGHQVALKQLLDNKNRLIDRLNQMEQRNREIINRATDPIIVVAEGGNIESVNPAASHMLNCSSLELVGKSFHEFLEDVYAKQYQECFTTVDESQLEKKEIIDQGPREVRIKKNNGQLLSVDLSVSQIGFDKIKYLCLIHDLTMHHNLVQELRHLTNIDKLTNLANRRKLDEFYSNEWYRCLRNRLPISILFIDIDYFKLYNDYYGHHAGDNCLQMVAAILEANVSRPADLIARYGGEEFVAILPETHFEGAKELAERIRYNIEAMGQEHKTSEVSDCITVSIGVSSGIPDDSLPPDSLREFADSALYKAKKRGRNQVKGVKI